MTDTPKSSKMEREQPDGATIIVEKPVPSISESMARIVNKLTEVYFGEEDSISISRRSRISYSYGGALCVLAFGGVGKIISSIFGDNVGNFKNISDISYDLLATGLFLSLVLIAAPYMLSRVIGDSIKNGGPLRFFLIGFFLYGMMLSFASLIFV